MKLAMVVHDRRPQAGEAASQLRAGCEKRGIEVVPTSSPELDIVVAIGGDGTVLRAARVALGNDVPLIGVNVGRKGFLADVEPSTLAQALDTLASGTWRESPRMTVQARLDNGTSVVGINDVVVEKSGGHSLISIEVSIDGEQFIDYHADGLVFATPTGSTAYNLSAGGPLVDPEVEALILSPVAPHSLFSKSIVLHPDAEIECRIVADRPASVSVDGRDLGIAEEGETITISRGSRQVRFIEVSGRSFVTTVKEKFHLDEDHRSVGG